MIFFDLSRWRRLLPISTALLLCTSLSACLEDEPEALPYLGVNHTDEWVPTFLINGEGGVVNVPPQGGGGKSACCVTVPKRWHPDLKAKVTWRKQGHWLTDAQGKEVLRDGQKVLVEGPWIERTVSVPEYTNKDLAHFDVHFFPGDQVQVKVSFIYPWHKDYLPRYPPQHPDQP